MKNSNKESTELNTYTVLNPDFNVSESKKELKDTNASKEELTEEHS